MYFNEILDPLKEFYEMRSSKKMEILILVGIPLISGILFFALSYLLKPNDNFSLYEFTNDLFNQLITVLALFISFAMAFLTIMATSSSQNVNDLKGEESKEYYLKSIQGMCSLYQVLMSEIVYALTIEIFFLLLMFVEKFVINISNSLTIRCIIAVDLVLLVHILIIMLVIIKDVYFAFWKSK